jgi:hypothetical protein
MSRKGEETLTKKPSHRRNCISTSVRPSGQIAPGTQCDAAIALWPGQELVPGEQRDGDEPAASSAGSGRSAFRTEGDIRSASLQLHSWPVSRGRQRREVVPDLAPPALEVKKLTLGINLMTSRLKLSLDVGLRLKANSFSHLHFSG